MNRNWAKAAGLAALGLLATACNDGGADADGDGTLTNEEVAAEAASGDAVQMRAGQWEHTVAFTELDAPGVPEAAREAMTAHVGQDFTTTSCLTEEEANRPNPEFFRTSNQGDCTYEEFDRSGDSMSLKMTCDTGGGMSTRIAMDGEFGAESFTLNMDNTITGGPTGELTMKGTVTGRRIGDCPG